MKKRMLGIILTIVGVLFLIKPSLVWLITENWKQMTEPNLLSYIWSTRFGGIVLTIVGIGAVIVAFQ